MISLDALDRRILAELQRDGRVSNQELADRVGLSPSPCLRRVRRLEHDGVIAGYRAVVDPDVVGLTITAFVRLTLGSHSPMDVGRVEEEIRSIPEVVEAYLLAGDEDFLIKIVAPSFAAYETVLRTRLRTIPSLASIRTTFAFGITKAPSPLPLG